MKQNIQDMEDYADSVAEAKKELKDVADKAETVFSQAKGGAQDVAKDLEARKGSGLEKITKRRRSKSATTCRNVKSSPR